MKRSIPRHLCLLLAVAALAVGTWTAGAAETVRLATYIGLADDWEAFERAFNETHSDIVLEVEAYPFGEYIDKIVTMIASGTPPDIVQTWAQYKAAWVENGLLLDLTDRWANSETLQQAEFYPFMLDAAKYKGRFYGVPYDYNAMIYFLNLDLFDAAGLEYPGENWTVDEMRAFGQKTTNENWGTYGMENPVHIGWGQNIQWMVNWAGHEWLDETYSRVLVAEQQALDMLNWWYENQYHLRIVPHAGSYPPRGGFMGGGVAMWHGWIDTVFQLERTGAYRWGYALFPKAPAGQTNFAQGHMFSIPYNARNVDVAWKVLEWLGSYDGQKAALVANHRQPSGPYPDLWELYFQDLNPEHARNLGEWVYKVLYGKAYARNLNYWTTFPEMNSIMEEHLRRIFSEHRPIRAEMEEAARRMQLLLEGS